MAAIVRDTCGRPHLGRRTWIMYEGGTHEQLPCGAKLLPIGFWSFYRETSSPGSEQTAALFSSRDTGCPQADIAAEDCPRD
jgi:hypothetical protein